MMILLAIARVKKLTFTISKSKSLKKAKMSHHSTLADIEYELFTILHRFTIFIT